jgi:uncharacterized protein YukE
MASDATAVGPAELRAAASSAGALSRDIRAQLATVTDATEQAVAAAVNADAGMAVLGFAIRWTHHLQALSELIAGVQLGIESAADAYERTDQVNAARFQARPR